MDKGDPATDLSTDYAGPRCPQGDAIDMGAYEYEPETFASPGLSGPALQRRCGGEAVAVDAVGRRAVTNRDDQGNRAIRRLIFFP